MSQPVWKSRTSKEPDPLLIALCAGRDTAATPPADQALLGHDIRLNMAHAVMLCRKGIIESATAAKILKGLTRLERRARRGDLTLDPSAEDVHINVEQALAGLAGEDAAGRLHTARSRNDQAATDMRLWLRDAVLAAGDSLAALATGLLKRARRDAEVTVPGFTHMQPAQVTTLGHLWACHASALTRDVQSLASLRVSVNRCPLGAAASFGTAWPIDRSLTARLLGFDGPTLNSLDSVANRWEPEARAAQAWAIALTHLSALAQDVIWMSTPPREWVRLDDAHVTGSSIMPQKRNPDIAEVTRARAAACQANAQAILATATGQLTGYNRDLQWTKYRVMDAWSEFDGVPQAWARVVDALAADRTAMRDACEVGFMEAAEVADDLCRRTGEPFRRMHHVLARAVAACEKAGRLTREALNKALADEGIDHSVSAKAWERLQSPADRLRLRGHVGAPAPKRLREDISAIQSELREAQSALKSWRLRIARGAKALAEASDRILDA